MILLFYSSPLTLHLIVSRNHSEAVVEVDGGESHFADIVIAADGLNSMWASLLLLLHPPHAYALCLTPSLAAHGEQSQVLSQCQRNLGATLCARPLPPLPHWSPLLLPPASGNARPHYTVPTHRTATATRAHSYSRCTLPIHHRPHPCESRALFSSSLKVHRLAWLGLRE
jgi:2-polyprenyl-6-methoxyphenol hydroxylase-like FAD-dependent oxidoreductase